MPARKLPLPLALAATLALYFVTGRLGLLAPFTSGNVSPIWPAAGAALAALAVFGLRVWPAVALGAFLVNFLTPVPAGAAVVLGLGNATGAVVGAYLLAKLAPGRPRAARLRDVVALVAVAVVSPPFAATIGTTGLRAFHVGAWSDYWTAWRVWWAGDGMGVLLAAPLLLSLGELRAAVRQRAKALEVGALATLTLVACLAVFDDLFGAPTKYGVPALALFPFIVWGALRFRTAGAALASAIIATLAVLGTNAGKGPFTRFDPLADALLLQFFLAVVSITGLIVAAVTDERLEAGDALRQLSRRLLHLQDEERRRLARELHDGTGQTLSALRLSLAAARKQADKESPTLERLLGQSMSAAEDIIRDIRTLSYLLHPPLLDDAGLASALRWYVDGLTERGRLRIELDLPEDLGRLPRDAETAVFRIVQECLTNVVRHSASDHATVRIRQSRGELRVVVADRGRGISDAAREGSTGVGIRGMRERMRDLGGSLTITRARPGTVVEAVLPV